MATLGAGHDGLHDAAKGLVDDRGIKAKVLIAHLLCRLLAVRTIKLLLCTRSLLVLQLFKEVDQELVAIVLHQGVEVAFNDFAQIGTYYPLLGLTAFTEHDRKEVVEVIAVLPAVFLTLLALNIKCEVLFEDEMVAQFIDRQQTLQAGIHIAVESVILKTYNPVLKSRHFFCFLRTFLLLGSRLLTLNFALQLRLYALRLRFARPSEVIVSFELHERFVVNDGGSTSVQHIEKIEEILVHQEESLGVRLLP